jgi:pristinamycin I synthase-3/4
VPVGVPGELLIGGAGLARGYHGRPDLTAEKFIPHPFAAARQAAGARLYRTGDLARHLAGGRIECLGRIDHQVKVRGYRIEPGEIEAELGRHPGLRQAVVAVREDRPGDQRLVAWVVPSGERVPEAAELRSFLAERLPEPMVPAAFVALASLPVLPNGKVDRRALPAPAGIPSDSRAASSSLPRTPAEELLAGIFAEVLGLPDVGVEDDFFALGGHSLLATQLIARIFQVFAVELPLRVVFEARSVAAMAARVAALRGDAGAGGAPGVTAPPLVPRAAGADARGLPLSFAQERLWFLDQLVPGNPFYNIYGAVRIQGPLDEANLERAVRDVVRRHEALRTVFAVRDGLPVQVVQRAPAHGLATIDLTALAAAPRQAETDRLASAEGRRPHDLARGPLLRAHLVRLGAGDRVLMLNVHHIVADGWSMELLSREIAALYGAFARGEASPLPPLPVQYPDFALWQREWLAAGPLAAQLAYWRRQLAGLDEALELPADRPRSAVESFRGGHLEFDLAPRLAADLTALARRHGATPAMALLAAFQALLGRDTGRLDVPVGVAIANRTRREVEELIGFFVNTLVLRLDLGGRPGLAALLGRVRDVALAAYDHQDLPFERLVEELNPGRSLARNPLVQVLFGFQNFPRAAVDVGGLTFAPLAGSAADPGTSKFDLTLFLFEQGASLSANLEYNRDLFDAATVRRLAARFQVLLAAAVGEPEAPVAGLPLLGAAERHQLLHEWNPGATSYPAEPGLAALFARQAARRPAALAVRYGDTLLTYAELRHRAGGLARRLRALGVGVDSRVGLAVERSPELVAAMLGIVEAGGAYVPLDPDYPRARLDYILRDSGLQVLVATETALAALPAAPAELGVAHVVLLGAPGDVAGDGGKGSPVAPRDLGSTAAAVGSPAVAGGSTAAAVGWTADAVGLPAVAGGLTATAVGSPAAAGGPPAAGPASLAYVIYTSGSTGEPKGVEVPQGAVARLVLATDYLQLGPDDRVGQAANANFDAITFEVWGPLLNGGCIVGIDKDVALAPAALARLLCEERVTAMFLTTALFNQTIREEPGAFAGLDTLLVGGEALDPGWIRKALAGAPPRRLLNGYGPTESTTFASWHRVAAPPAEGATVPIGLPLANTSLHVLDGELQPVAIGVAGQLAIGGDGLARGYCRRPAATAERFVPDPFAGPAGARLYLTGDRVRRRADGAIEFLGRLDRQVKIRGFRIEPGEIEARLREHPAVGECVVAALPAGGGGGDGNGAAAERRLVAYVVQDPDWEGAEAAGTQHDQVTQWGVVFDDIYHRDAADPDPTFNFVGWDSTYTGEPLPRAEMVEWLDDTLARISALEPRRVLEIGCGTGMLLFRLAPRCEAYWGTDVSARALAYVESRLGDLAVDPARVRLLARPADCFDGIAPGSFDTVILNSVVQYFPSAEYLAGVLAAAATAVRPGGAIFLGDLRSLPLLPAFHLAVELARADPALPLAGLRARVLARRQLENELALAPAFFADLQRRVPAIHRVEIHPKRGRAHNELTAFRYQVVLRVGAGHGAAGASPALPASGPPAAAGAAAAQDSSGSPGLPSGVLAWRDWRASGLTLDRLRGELASDGAGLIALSGIPNLRLATEVAAARLALGAPGNGHGALHAGEAKAAAAVATAGELRRLAAAAAAASGAVDPQALWDLAAQLSYEIEIGWAEPGTDGAFTALLRRRTAQAAAPGLGLPPPVPGDRAAPVPALAELLPQPVRGRTAAELANRPLRGRFARRLAPELRAFLAERLPESMLPSAFVLLDALPLNANGKVDTRRLPPPEAARGDAAGALAAPRTALEEQLAAIWAELLGLARVGVDESFFDLGGHSLVGAQLISRLRQALEIDLPLRVLFEAPTVAAMAAEIERLRHGAGAPDLRTIASFRGDRDSPPPLSFAQERYWSGRHLEARSVASTVPLLMHLAGPLDRACLRRAVAAVVERHELLRTSFRDGPAGSIQVIHPAVPVSLPVVDLERLGAAERTAEVRRFSILDGRLHFDYERPPLFRQTLFRGGAEEHVLLFTIHHVAADWWSSSILIREVSALYLAFRAGRPSPLPPVVVQFQDFARWQRRLSQEAAYASQVTFWREHLRGAVPVDLGAGRPRPKKPTYTAALEEIRVPAGLERQLDAFSARHGVTLFTTMLAAFKALLHHETGQDDLVVPCSFANRNQLETESLMGNLATNLPLRTRLAGVRTFRELLQRVRDVALQAHDHPDIFWEPVVAGMSFLEEGDRGGLTTFRIMFQLIKEPVAAEMASDLRITQLGVDTGKIRLDMSLYLTQGAEPGRLSGRFRYHRDVLDRARVAGMRDRYLRILAAVVADPECPLAELPLADPLPQEPGTRDGAMTGTLGEGASSMRPVELACGNEPNRPKELAEP